ncbi:MAG TPA: tetratricopeptide repeat protein [Flavobacteriales bacterium]|jgi:tetratricopeptide (TPR) repeat protein|nr:tetratricopeptide repeat protein [Flavobacteriales bacterium]MCC6910392.1 tetratricopeptide repeat protein [Flavobacteriales bacterium]HQW06652.1 tetratricopeptide repeat protein [Flavobacteriales bacterium]HQY00985.1 tetratricopeptide repeat protein [Flavobacteriales bacterium]
MYRPPIIRETPMNEGPLPQPERNEFHDCVGRYEAMRDQNTTLFFDVEEFEIIIEHYLEQSDTRAAQEVLVHAQLQHPGSMDLMFCEAHVLMNLGKLNRALAVLDAIGKVEPFNEDVQLHKASIYSQLRNYRRAVEHYKRALELAEEGLDDIHLDLAFEYENLEAFDLAIDSLKRALEINPENEAVLYELAYCFDLADAHQAAISYFRQFTNEHPYAFVAWYNLGNALSHMERLDDSIEALDYCLAIEERFTSAYFSKARNLLVQGKFQEAIDCYQETIAFDGAQAITFSYVGECYEKMERYEQALIHYDQALALDPNWVDAWIGRGVVKDVQGRLPEAIKDLEQAVKLSPEHGDGWFYLGNSLARNGRYEEAFGAYAKLNVLEPENIDGWLDHADLLLQMKGPDAAARKLREGDQVHRLTSRYRYRMVSYLLQMGELQQALIQLEDALMADHAAHPQLLEHYPAAAQLPQVVHLLELYRRS